MTINPATSSSTATIGHIFPEPEASRCLCAVRTPAAAHYDGGSRAATRCGRLVIADDRSLVRALDAAFVSQKRAKASGPVLGYWQARDLVVEVLSPGGSYSQLHEKTLG